MTTRPPIRAVLVAAAALFASLFLVGLAPTIATTLSDVVYRRGDALEYFPGLIGQHVQTLLGANLTASLWILLWFWVILPVRSDQRMSRVALRALLGAVVAAVVATLVYLLWMWLPLGGRLGGFVEAFGGARGFARSVINIGSQVVVDLVFAVPLAAVLLWGWLRRSAASPTPASVPATTQEVSA